MKIDLKDLSEGSLNISVLRKIIKEIADNEGGDVAETLIIVDDGKETILHPKGVTNTKLLIEILGILKNIDCNVEKIANQTK